MSNIRFVHMGLGPMGAKVCKMALGKDGLELVGVLELANVGKDAGEVLGLGEKTGVLLSDDIKAVLASKPDIVVNTTLSSLEKVKDQLIPILEAGINVVSTCEELAYSWDTTPEISAALDKAAKENNVTVLGTGVNPGFTMEFLPIVITGPCERTDHFLVERIQDATSRRKPFQKKIGAGCSVSEFNELKSKGTLRHVGLRESCDMIAAAMGWRIDEYSETIDPMMLDREVSSEFITVQVGQAAGVEQISIAKMGGKEIIRMVFQAYLGAPETYDAIHHTGIPNMESRVINGVHGDIATAAMTVNAIPRVITAPPGLLTMMDLPPVHTFSGNWGTLI
ncbi:dihydrodipicolinate reductase [Chloroflexota bacterium]